MAMTEIIPTEQEEHLALYRWIKTQPKIAEIAIHIPNEGKRDARYGNKLKRMGLKAGVSDFFIPYPTHKYHGLWIELKRIKGSRLSTEQLWWIEKMRSLDFKACFAYGFNDARNIILSYLSDEIPKNLASKEAYINSITPT